MIKRIHKDNLTIYRRHASSCPVKDDSTKLDACQCPIWIHGKVRGVFTRKSLETRSLIAAVVKKDQMLNGRDDDPTPDGGIALVGKGKVKPEDVTLRRAQQEFVASNRRKGTATRRSYATTIEHFTVWAEASSLAMLHQIDKADIRAYFEAFDGGWTNNTAMGILTRLRVFFNFCKNDRRWIDISPAAGRDLNYDRYSTRLPFSPTEVTAILAAVERMPEAMRDRARALILLLLYSGMRISDATFFERACLTPTDCADFWIIKTRSPISLAPELQAPAIEALKKLPPSRTYFFQPDVEGDYAEARRTLRSKGDFSAVMPGYVARVQEMRRMVLKVLAIAGLKGACHRFRDTFAVNLLHADVDVFSVSQYLGHSDVKITMKHYVKLVPGYSDRMSQKTRGLAYQFPMAG